MKKYEVELFVTEDERHAPYFIQGLLELESSNLIDLKIESMPLLIKNRWVLNADKHHSNKGYPWCLEALVTRHDGTRKKIGIDLQDWSEFFSAHAIKNCDIIFKRAYDSRLVNEYKKQLPKKILPLGPNHSCQVTDERVLKKIKKSKLKQLLAKGISEPSKITKTIKKKLFPPQPSKVIFNNEKVISAPPSNEYVFFQVECHNWKSNKHAAGLNEYRAGLIRKLREELKDRFIGGMFFKDEIISEFSDCLTNVDPDPSNYRKFVDHAAVVISTNGFGESIPWKLVEYMNWGCCILTEKNKHSFREPIPFNTLNEFETFEQCAKLCHELLADEKKRSLQKENSTKYYFENISAKQSALRILDNAFLT